MRLEANPYEPTGETAEEPRLTGAALAAKIGSVFYRNLLLAALAGIPLAFILEAGLDIFHIVSALTGLYLAALVLGNIMMAGLQAVRGTGLGFVYFLNAVAVPFTVVPVAGIVLMVLGYPLVGM